MTSQVHAKHILVQKETEAYAVLGELRNGKSFEDTAREKSLCPSKRNGGDLGWFGRNQMVKEFETAAFSLEIGKTSLPIKTQFGYHIIKVIEKK